MGRNGSGGHSFNAGGSKAGPARIHIWENDQYIAGIEVTWKDGGKYGVYGRRSGCGLCIDLAPEEHIKEIEIWDGHYVDAIRITTTKNEYAKFGGNGGGKRSYKMSPDEDLVGLTGRCGEWVDKLYPTIGKFVKSTAAETAARIAAQDAQIAAQGAQIRNQGAQIRNQDARIANQNVQIAAQKRKFDELQEQYEADMKKMVDDPDKIKKKKTEYYKLVDKDLVLVPRQDNASLAVTGAGGQGKSTFINTMIGLGREFTPEGETDTTLGFVEVPEVPSDSKVPDVTWFDVEGSNSRRLLLNFEKLTQYKAMWLNVLVYKDRIENFAISHIETLVVLDTPFIVVRNVQGTSASWERTFEKEKGHFVKEFEDQKKEHKKSVEGVFMMADLKGGKGVEDVRRTLLSMMNAIRSQRPMSSAGGK